MNLLWLHFHFFNHEVALLTPRCKTSFLLITEILSVVIIYRNGRNEHEQTGVHLYISMAKSSRTSNEVGSSKALGKNLLPENFDLFQAKIKIDLL